MRNTIILAAVAALFLLASCGRADITSRLSDIESYIDARPDSALVAIRQIDTTTLRSRAVKAKYSLLHAIALDKNYIDTADTRIAQPAVDWYDRHGTPEERLKAWMYLGTEQYNGGRYNQAIVSFSQAAEQAEMVDDQNLLGILYSRMADTFTTTGDHSMASSYIKRALDCFRKCCRKDQEKYVRLREAGNFTQRRMWSEADSCFRDILSDPGIDGRFRSKVLINYAMFLLSSSENDERSAFGLFTNALDNGGRLSDEAQMAAYAYLSGGVGRKDIADSLWHILESKRGTGEYDYNYWRHREKLRSGDYEGAYKNLWLAMREKESMIRTASEQSAAASQREFLEIGNKEKDLRIKTRDLFSLVMFLSCMLVGMALLMTRLLYRRNKMDAEEREERMKMVITSLENRVLKAENNAKKVKYAFLSDIYEEAYRIEDNDGRQDAFGQVIRSRIGDLRSDNAARARFEKMIDIDMDGIMTQLRKSCPGLSEQEYMMACYYFAGFDNTAVMIIMDISSADNVRTRKKRLRQKIAGFGDKWTAFLAYL